MKKILLILFVSLFGLLMSCQEDEGLRDDLDDLTNRVIALENTVNSLNETLKGISALYTLDGGTISSVVNDGDDNYTLTLSNGETIVLAQGSDVAGAVVPQIGINDEGNWTIQTNGGALADTGIPAKGENGKVPELRVDDKGYWQISYGDGVFEDVKDENGDKVIAVGDGTPSVGADKFFDDIKIEDGNLVVTLKGSIPMLIPIVPNFSCYFDNAGELQYFKAQQARTFVVNIVGTNNVSILNVPTDWKASLSPIIDKKATLTVTAPEGLSSRAIADTETDITLLAIHPKGFSAMSKIQVVIGTFTINSPIITLGDVEATSIVFTATNNSEVADAELKYIVQQASMIAPTVDVIFATQNIATSGVPITVSNLVGGAAYTIYVAGSKSGAYSALVMKNVTTDVAVINYYEDYLAGKAIVINGTELVKSAEDDVIVLMSGPAPTTVTTENENVKIIYDVAENSDITTHVTVTTSAGNKIIFIDNKLKVTITTKISIASSLYFIGINGNTEKLPVLDFVNPTTYIECKKDIYIKNMKLVKKVAAGANGYMFNSANSNFGSLLIEDSEIQPIGKDASIVYDSSTKGLIANIKINNSVINLSETTKGLYNCAYKSGETDGKVQTVMNEFLSFSITNTVIYSSTNKDVSLVMLFPVDATKGMPNLDMTIRGNTFYGVGRTASLIYCSELKTADVMNNIVWINANVNYVFFSVYQKAVSVNVTKNRLYNASATHSWLIKQSTSEVDYIGVEDNIITKNGDSNPIASGNIVENGYFPSAYLGIGADYTTKMWVVKK